MPRPLSWHCLPLGLIFAVILVAGGNPRAEASVTLARRRSPGFPKSFRGILLPRGGARFWVGMTLRGGGGGGGGGRGGRERERQGEEEEEGSSSRLGGEMGTPNPKRPRHAVETVERRGEEVSKTPEDISEAVEGDSNVRGHDRREDEDEDEESKGGKEGKPREQGRGAGQEEEGKGEEEEEGEEEDEQEEEDDDDEYADWVEDEGGIDNTMAGLKAAQEDIDRALSLLDQTAKTAIPKELDPEVIKQKAAEDKSMEEIPADFLEQLEVLEKEGALGGGKEGTGEDDEPMSESAEASDQVRFAARTSPLVGRTRTHVQYQTGCAWGTDPKVVGWCPLPVAAVKNPKPQTPNPKPQTPNPQPPN